MSIPGSANLLLLKQAAAGGYAIERSLRFNSSDSAYLSRTPVSSGSLTNWTWSGWCKRGTLGAGQALFGLLASTNVQHRIGFKSDDTIEFLQYNGSFIARRDTTQVFRDPSAWYHIVATWDTTNATAASRMRLYVNGVQVTAFSASVDPSSSLNGFINNSSYQHGIGWAPTNGDYLSALLADLHFCDGTAYDASAFGEFDDNGIWQPKAFAGTYGTNGFRLDFADNASTTTIGYDAAGSNDWTANNLSVTAGAGNDSLVDVPTNGAETDTGAGGEVRGNYCTWNPLSGSLDTRTLSNGNLDTSNGGNGNTYSTFELTSGKHYFEATLTAISGSSGSTIIGLTASAGNRSGDNAQNLTPNVCYAADGNKLVDASSSAYGASYTANDVIGVAVDIDAGSITFYKNGASQGSISKTFVGAGKGSWVIFTVAAAGGASNTWVLNAGQRPFAYTAPSGFKALNTANLPAPTITQPSTVMDVKLYTGNGSTQTISGLGFSPDLVWIKNRAAADNHKLTDIVRGATEELESNTTDAEATNADGLTQFNADGFDLGDDDEYNTSAEAYVAWAWDAGSSTVTNTSGSISSQVRANASAGFSVVTYTTTGSAGTIGHGLGVAPSFIITKQRNGTTAWYCYHTSIGAGNYVLLNSTAASAAGSSIWNSTAPTSTVFSVGNGFGNGETYVAYCFSPLSGYSSFGSYTGNGSTDGPFVYTGFRPRWIMIKRTDSTSNWVIWDTLRADYNEIKLQLFPNTSDSEDNTGACDALSNGFKLRSTNATWNGSGTTHIYAAFAEHPFQYARAR